MASKLPVSINGGEIDTGTLALTRHQAPAASNTGPPKPKSRAWSSDDIGRYRQWVRLHGADFVKAMTVDCADFALFLLLEFAKNNNLRLALKAAFRWRDPFAERSVPMPSLDEAQRRLGARDLYDVGSGNTVAIEFDKLLSGDLLTSKVHVQVVLSPRTLVTVKDIVKKTMETNVPVLDIIQGNLGSGKPVLVTHRAYDLRENSEGTRTNNYYEYHETGKYYYPYALEDRTQFEPRRWNFGFFNRGSLT